MGGAGWRKSRHDIPDRAGFGLPLLFKRRVGSRREGENVTWALPGDEKDGDTRRSSPLLLHVARFGQSYIPILTYLPAKLIPGKLKFEGKAKMFEPTGRQLGIVNEFLDDLASKSLIEEVKP